MDKFQRETPWSIFALGKFREGYSENLHTLHTSEAIEKAGRKPGPKKDIIQSSKAIRMLILFLHVNFNLLVHWPFLYRGKLSHRSSQASPFSSSIPPGQRKPHPSGSQVQASQRRAPVGSVEVRSLFLDKPSPTENRVLVYQITAPTETREIGLFGGNSQKTEWASQVARW